MRVKKKENIPPSPQKKTNKQKKTPEVLDHCQDKVVLTNNQLPYFQKERESHFEVQS